MNIPKRMMAKMRFAHLNLTLEKTYPLIDPKKEEIKVAGITNKKLFFKFILSFWKASMKPSKEILVGSFHIVEMETSSKFFREVASKT